MATVSLQSAFSTVFIERRLPWRVEQWLSSLGPVRSYRERRLERWDRDLYKPYVKPGDLVFDIGANRGDKTAIFLDHGARVVAVEPDAEVAAALSARFAGSTRCHIVEAGVGAQVGAQEFQVSPHSTRSTFAADRMRTLEDGVEYGAGPVVRITTLDELIAAHGVPKFCKIDVEGYEPEVFRGLTQPVPVLSFEFHGELLSDARFCLEHLHGLGMSRFNLVLHPVGGQRHQTLDHLLLDDFISKDEVLRMLETLAAKHRLAGDVWAFSPSR